MVRNIMQSDDGCHIPLTLIESSWGAMSLVDFQLHGAMHLLPSIVGKDSLTSRQEDVSMKGCKEVEHCD